MLLWVNWGANGTSLCASLLQESLFPARVVYDLLFFFIVIIIVLNLIFGVIIDTFADLRSEKQKKEEILKTTCFICGEAWLPQECRSGWPVVWAKGSCSLTFSGFLWPPGRQALGLDGLMAIGFFQN